MGLSEGKLPSVRREDFFEETLWLGADELLCIPTPLGCIVRQFSATARGGGRALYRISKCMSYCPNVLRYEVEALGVPRPAVVGVLDREEVHMRAKTGEFIRIASWKVTSRKLEWKNEHLHRQGVRATSSEPLRIVIATQGHMRVDGGVPIPETMKFREFFTDGNPDSSCSMGRSNPKKLEDLDLMEFSLRGKKSGNAKKSVHPGTGGRPYLGFQLTPSDVAMPQGMEHLLDHERLIMFLTLLCWSESTMHTCDEPTESYIETMMTPVDKQPKAIAGANWTAEDVKRLLHAEALQSPVALQHWRGVELPEAQDAASSRADQDARVQLVRAMTRNSSMEDLELEKTSAEEVVSPSNAGQKPDTEVPPLEQVTILTPDEEVHLSASTAPVVVAELVEDELVADNLVADETPSLELATAR